MWNEIDLPDDVLRELGAIASTFGTVEFVVDNVLLLLIDPDTQDHIAASAIVADEPLHRQTRRIQALADVRLSRDLNADVRAWLSRVREASERRNRTLHAVWVTKPGSEPTIETMRRRRGAVESRHASIEELRETTRFLLDVLIETDDIYDRIADEAIHRMIAEGSE